jgi:hypothetical protein
LSHAECSEERSKWSLLDSIGFIVSLVGRILNMATMVIIYVLRGF